VKGDHSDEHTRDGILGGLLAYQWRSVEIDLSKGRDLYFLITPLTFDLGKALEPRPGGVDLRLETTQTWKSSLPSRRLDLDQAS
jgi:hypothetical protein